MRAKNNFLQIDRIALLALLIVSLIPIYHHIHIVEDDFLEIINSADGFFRGLGYCFAEVYKYEGIESLTGITGRPPLVPLILSLNFYLFGHNLLAVFATYLLPRIAILPFIYLILRFYLKPSTALLGSTLLLFFPYFETYAASTLKADIFVSAFSLISVYFALLWQRTSKNRYLALTGLFLALNALSKETAAAFSVGLFFILTYKIYAKNQDFVKNIFYLLAPVIVLILPFVIFSLINTGKIFPSVYADSIDLSSFPLNIKTYLLSVLFFFGINFNLSKFITVNSIIKLILIVLGISYAYKRKYFEIFIPAILLIVGICMHITGVVQGASIGNREIIHRVSPIIPFLVAITSLGTYWLSTFISRLAKTINGHLVTYTILIALNLSFINYYFRAPLALDYTDKEFYVNAKTIVTDRVDIPIANFVKNDRKCVVAGSYANVFLTSHYYRARSSAFPTNYKEILVGSWLLIVTYSVFLLKRKN